MPAPTIRPAHAGDASTLAAVAAATFGLACPPDTLPESVADFIATVLSLERFEEYLADADRELFVADDDGTLVGYTMIVHGDPYDADAAAAVTARPTSELSKCYVLPDAHGSGLARALVERSVEASVEHGSLSVWLGVNQLNARANRFYDKCGFERVGTKRFKVGARWEHDFVRERRLDPVGA